MNLYSNPTILSGDFNYLCKQIVFEPHYDSSQSISHLLQLNEHEEPTT